MDSIRQYLRLSDVKPVHQKLDKPNKSLTSIKIKSDVKEFENILVHRKKGGKENNSKFTCLVVNYDVL